MKTIRSLALLTALLGIGCNQVDYIEIKPDQLILRQKNNEIWLQGHAKSHTGQLYSMAPIVWSVADESIARVDATGKLTPVKSGLTDVIATHGKVVARAPVQVLFAEKITVTPTSVTLVEGGPPVELNVKVYDFKGRELSDRSATYRSLDKNLVSMGQNAVFPLAPGTTKVEVQVEEQKQIVEVTVTADKQAANK